MPVSKTRKKKDGAKAGPRKPGYRPGAIAIDEERVIDVLLELPIEALPTIGLTTWYLASAPSRQANQCLLASAVLLIATRSLGIESHLVGMTLDIPWARNGRGVRYGNESPHVEGNKVVGHVGLIAADRFIDPTAGQFPEVRGGRGFRPVGGRIFTDPSQRAVAIARGASFQARTYDGKDLIYHLLPIASVDKMGADFLAENTQELALQSHNLVVSFGAALAGLGEARVAEILNGPSSHLARLVADSIGKRVELQGRQFVRLDADE